MLQIIVLAVCGLIGTLVRQLPAFALRDPAAYERELADLHLRYDPITILGLNVGPTMVDVFERLGFFRIFTVPWFSGLLLLLVASIVVCTVDRWPRLWRQVGQVRPVQPEPFFDLRLPHRARLGPSTLSEADLAAVLRERHFAVRAVADPRQPGVRHLHGDRNRWARLATFVSHAGLVLFLLGGFVTGAFGFETVLFVGEGQTAPVQPVGTPGNLLVKNLRFEAPTRPDGSFEDFRTDLVVYRDGVEVAQKRIRVNEPLEVDGYVFHQNTFGPAATLEIRDGQGRLAWEGPVIMPPDQAVGLPRGFLTIPGSDIGLLLFLDRDESGAGLLKLLGLATSPDGSGRPVFGEAIRLGRTTDPTVTGGYTIRWAKAGAFSGLVVKRDPGEPIVYLAFLGLIVGLAGTFYLPRRRVWVRLEGDGQARLAFLADRYVDAEREFGELLEALARRAGRRPEARRVGAD
ncbi:MAG TPA: cytochrome c biogenesis protein ResB [Candidatus Limnocylindrales bacterium]|nr:cytochrome c biogenesis protein ResB [Candidatus Limnocylindrales bacterium]